MRISYPRSFLRLLLLGYGLTMLPLLLAFGNASLYVDRLAEQSQNTLSQAVQATRSSRVLLEQLNVMERSARQYFVLEDKLLLDNYQIAHDKFIETIRELSMIPLSQDQQRVLRLLADSESRLFNDILIQTHSLTPPETIVAEFSELAAQAQDILSENNRLIDRESQALAEADANATANVATNRDISTRCSAGCIDHYFSGGTADTSHGCRHSQTWRGEIFRPYQH